MTMLEPIWDRRDERLGGSVDLVSTRSLVDFSLKGVVQSVLRTMIAAN